MRADLHLHSVYSDGKFSPGEVVRFAMSKELSIIALSDHDCVDGIEEFRKAAISAKMKAVGAVELSCRMNSKEIHILGIFINHKNRTLQAALRDFKVKRKTRALLMLEKLNGMGIGITEDDLAKFISKGLYGRMHIAQAMLKKGYVKSSNEAFSNYIGNSGPAYVPKEYFSPCQAIELIKSAGGFAVLAHPGSSNLRHSDMKKLANQGIRGIEAVHPKHSRSKEEDLKKFCEDNRLVVCGGSDFHGYEKQEFDNLGSKYVTLSSLERFRKALENVR